MARFRPAYALPFICLTVSHTHCFVARSEGLVKISQGCVSTRSNHRHHRFFYVNDCNTLTLRLFLNSQAVRLDLACVYAIEPLIPVDLQPPWLLTSPVPLRVSGITALVKTQVESQIKGMLCVCV